MADIFAQSKLAAEELIRIAGISAGAIVVVGCSSSEVEGYHIGKHSDPNTALQIYEGLQAALIPRGIWLAAQCCEHLNRAIVIERQATDCREIVNVIPQPKAGGSFATAAYHNFRHPVVLEEIRADAGLDIGGTLIGMHLRPVAVPVRLSIRNIGQAILLAARTRPKYIGGERAIYNQEME